MAAIDPTLHVYLDGLLRHGRAYVSEYDGRVHLSLPERLPHIHSYVRCLHVCKGGEHTLDLAVQYFSDGADPVDAAPIIAEFQPDPILDLTVPLPVGTIVLIPSQKYVMGIAYGDSLSELPEI